ncbi:hypothetical protein GUITHDRAFT_104978 [Guillardia theta CCMP2712]|uniref:PDZ domain-containing protein n=1 Tax=Guillardia theta (strain CCMP2712) TaxID=905079 RepID=L1JMG0_GUITC|nr:hypothetical protein GUITHDRAFT_104978 [Guillardia theta CCMP2712]EKX49449.1 hypothetical protein GUITHDRAFT_104978 [Guillardia theta CCMP2712]|eukprot:XP_005836429.1 hypothetical protein GUITHDRAFT_104978 [Guillardia theta CCMP2712]
MRDEEGHKQDDEEYSQPRICEGDWLLSIGDIDVNADRANKSELVNRLVMHGEQGERVRLVMQRTDKTIYSVTLRRHYAAPGEPRIDILRC